MRRRQFLSRTLLGGALAPSVSAWDSCPRTSPSRQADVVAEDPLANVASGLKITT